MSCRIGNWSVSDSPDRDLSCPDCGSEKIVTETIDHRFPYGRRDSAVELSARIPVRRCEECDDQFLDDEAEDLMHEAVCRHLHVMTPSEVRAVRQRLSRVEFARITRLGEATIGRWERGQLIQNAANDQFLHLLSFPENLIRLRNRAEKAELAAAATAVRATTRKFRVLDVTAELATEAAAFDLNTAGAA